MAINVTAASGSAVIETTAGAATAHDVVDLETAKAFKQVQVPQGTSFATGDAIAGSPGGTFKASQTNHGITGIAISNLASTEFGFIQSFGFGVAKVASGTPANSFLVPSTNPGELRAIDLDDPEMITYFIGLFDQRPGSATLPSPIRRVVSLTAESGGAANVFIF